MTAKHPPFIDRNRCAMDKTLSAAVKPLILTLGIGAVAAALWALGASALVKFTVSLLIALLVGFALLISSLSEKPTQGTTIDQPSTHRCR